VKRRPIPISWARPTPPLRGRARRSLSFNPRARPSPPNRRRARRRLALSPRARSCPPQRRRASRRLALSPRARPCPPQRRRARQRLALIPRVRQSYPKGVGRGGTKLLSFEQGTLRRPYPSRSFYRSVVIGSTFWGTPGIRSPTLLIASAIDRGTTHPDWYRTEAWSYTTVGFSHGDTDAGKMSSPVLQLLPILHS